METRPRRSPGWLLVGILFVVGGLFLGGLFATARWGVPAEYRNSTPGVPGQALRIASMDLGWKPVDVAAVAALLKEARADFVLLQGVSRRDAQAIGDGLGMRHGGQLQMVYSPRNSDDPNRPGNAILGRHGLFKGRVMQRKKTDSAGVVGEAVVGGKRFMLVSVDFAAAVKGKIDGAELEGLRATWEAAQEPPMIAGGDWGGASFTMEPRVATQTKGRFVLSEDWRGGQTESVGEAEVLETRPKD